MKKTSTLNLILLALLVAILWLAGACYAPTVPAPAVDATGIAGKTDKPMPPAEETPIVSQPVKMKKPNPELALPQSLPTDALPGPLPEGVESQAPPALSGADLLFFNGRLGTWSPGEEQVHPVEWPSVAILCPWLAPDGHTLYFSDGEGAKVVDLSNPQPPQLIIAHQTEDENPARHRRFCVVDRTPDGERLLFQGLDRWWYLLGIMDQERGVGALVESPFGPPGEPWHCPGDGVWGDNSTVVLSGYSTGRCRQNPGLFTVQWGEALVPTVVLSGTLPALGDEPVKKAGAWQLVRSPDDGKVAFWFDEDWARQDGAFLTQSLNVIDSDGNNVQQLVESVPGRNGPVAWAEDSQSLYYLSSEPFDTLDPHRWQLHRWDLGKKEDAIVWEFEARHAILSGPVQGNQLLVSTLADDIGSNVYAFDLTNGDIWAGPANAMILSWLG
ncbi:MAG: hypothetical protein U9R25_08260 [Chloroflexota bacterium]|nr:hypothetical protein [Chloroflexota bacterium]